MCGLVGRINFKGGNVNAKIIVDYIAQRNRGTEGFGFACVSNGKVITKRSTTEKGIIQKLLKYPSSAILFHHRQPSSTDNVIDSCHPFTVRIDDGKIILAHNGVIYNDDELLKSHNKMGIKYSSYESKTKKFNDSEALAVDFARYINGDQEKLEVHGWIAFIAFRLDKENNLTNVYFGRNASAVLNLKFTDNFISIGSQTNGEEIDDHTLYDLNMKTGKLLMSDLIIPSYQYESNYKYDWKKNTESTEENEDDYYSRLSKKYVSEEKDYEPDYFKGDGILAMSDPELMDYISALEFDIQSLESNPEAVKKKEFSKKLDDLYAELEYADEEMTERKMTYSRNGIMSLPLAM